MGFLFAPGFIGDTIAGESSSGARRDLFDACHRIPPEQWGKVWRVLVASGPISRLSQEPIYLVSDRQIRLLRRKKLPFELVPPSDGQRAGLTNSYVRAAL
jgi:hypothetical protein